MIATEQTKWFTEGEMASNGQVQGVIAAGVQASPDDKIVVDTRYDLFQLLPEQVILRMGVLVRNPTEAAWEFDIGYDYSPILADIRTDVAGLTEVPIGNLPPIGINSRLWFEVKSEAGGPPVDSILVTLEFYVWAVVADISNPATVYTTIMTPAP